MPFVNGQAKSQEGMIIGIQHKYDNQLSFGASNEDVHANFVSTPSLRVCDTII